VQTLLQGARRRAASEDELLREAEKTFDLLYDSFYEPPGARLGLAHLALVPGLQIAQPRIDHRELVEVAVAGRARKLKLLDRRRQAALQDVDLRLRLVLQQALAKGGIGLRLQHPQALVIRVAPQRFGEHGERLPIPAGVVQGVDVGVHDRPPARILRERVLEDIEPGVAVAERLTDARGERLDHRTCRMQRAQLRELRLGLARPLGAQQRRDEAKARRGFVA